MLKTLSLRSKVILVVALPVVLNSASLVSMYFIKEDAERQVSDEIFGAKLGATTAHLELSYYKAVTSATKWHSSRSDSALEKLKAAMVSIDADEKELVALLQNRPDIINEFDQYRKDAAESKQFLQSLRDGASTHFGGDLQPRIFQTKGQKLIAYMMEDVGKISDYAVARQHAGQLSREQRNWMTNIIVAMFFGNIVYGLLSMLFLSKDLLDRLAIVRKNALALATGEALVRLPGNDVIAELDHSLHDSALALEEAQQKETALIDNAIDVLCSIDDQLKFVRVSSAASRVWGYEPADVTGMRVVRLLNPDSTDTTIFEIEKVIKETSEGTFDSRLIRKDGKVIDVRFSAYWSAREKALYCVVRDVTREREFERIKQKLMDTVAHDLRSPISSIKVVLESLSMGLLGAQTDKAVVRIQKAEKSADRLLRLINDLLDYDKFESGQFNLDLQDGSLRDIIDGALVSIEALIEQSKLKVEVAGEDVAVHADADRLTQVLVNLLSNAVKFSPPDSVVSITCTNGNEKAIVEIRDHGPGIPENMKGQIFERFKQVEETAKTHKGTGLGLPIARQIVEAHKGEIGVRDAEGGGTVFWFSIARAICLLILFLSVLFAAPAVAGETSHKVTFPSKGKYATGVLVLLPCDTTGNANEKAAKMLGPARGEIPLPKDCVLSLMVTPEGATCIENLSGLKPNDLYKIRMHQVPVSDTTFKSISGLTGLVELDLSCTDTSDSALTEISKLTNLRTLDLSSTLIKGFAFSKLSSLTKLTDLDISENRLNPNAIKALAKACPKLETLRLSDTGATDANVAQITQLKNLDKLDLKKNNAVSDACLASLTAFKKLKTVDLRQTALTPVGKNRVKILLPNVRCKL